MRSRHRQLSEERTRGAPRNARGPTHPYSGGATGCPLAQLRLSASCSQGGPGRCSRDEGVIALPSHEGSPRWCSHTISTYQHDALADERVAFRSLAFPTLNPALVFVSENVNLFRQCIYYVSDKYLSRFGRPGRALSTWTHALHCPLPRARARPRYRAALRPPRRRAQVREAAHEARALASGGVRAARGRQPARSSAGPLLEAETVLSTSTSRTGGCSGWNRRARCV